MNRPTQFCGLTVALWLALLGIAVDQAQAKAQAKAQTTAQTRAVQNGTTLPSSPAAPSPVAPNGLRLIPFKQPVLTPQILHLIELESKFSEATANGGGKAFASFFADDGVVLGNAQRPIIGKAAIVANAQWEAAAYKLSWIPDAAQISPENDMGFTWGEYRGVTNDGNGRSVVTTGRYMTIWKLMPDKSWKVILESSSQEPPATSSN